jgi:hypothetical protein
MASMSCAKRMPQTPSVDLSLPEVTRADLSYHPTRAAAFPGMARDDFVVDGALKPFHRALKSQSPVTWSHRKERDAHFRLRFRDREAGHEGLCVMCEADAVNSPARRGDNRR